MSTPRSVLSESKLLEYSREHVFFEAAMFFQTGERILQTDFAGVPRMAIIEAFAVHTRNLVHFFYPKIEYKTDVLAKDFFDGGTLPGDFPTITDLLDTARTRANKEVGHLTQERIEGAPPEKAWPVSELMTEVGELLRQFARLASPSRLHSRVATAISTDRILFYGKVDQRTEALTSSTSSWQIYKTDFSHP